MNRALSCLLASALALGAPTATLACGQTLFGNGQGTRFQPYRAPVPATVLIYASPQVAKATPVADPRFRGALERAGHSVTVVQQPNELNDVLATRPFDVLITGESEIDAVMQRLSASTARPELLPVVDGATSAGAVEHSPRLLKANAGLGAYLKSINSIVSLRLK